MRYSMQFEAKEDGTILIMFQQQLVGYFTLEEAEETLSRLKQEIPEAKEYANQKQLNSLKEQLKIKLLEVDELKTIISTLESL